MRSMFTLERASFHSHFIFVDYAESYHYQILTMLIHLICACDIDVDVHFLQSRKDFLDPTNN